MWIFLPGGLTMPSAVPMDQADPAFTLGYRDIQVRARLTEHLEAFIEEHMTGLDYSDIQQTPDRDYNCRFYTTREALKAALASAVDDIDYDKFKPTTDRKNLDGTPKYRKAHKYHGVLNGIWSELTRLAPAGGTWGPRTADNPNGYEPRKHWADTPYLSNDTTSEVEQVKASWDTTEDEAWDAMTDAEKREYIEQVLADEKF